MRALTDRELFDAWEHGLSQSPIARALTLLAVAEGVSPEELADWPIGRRDAHMLELRERTFGSRLVALAECPSCSSRVEFSFQASDIHLRDNRRCEDVHFVEAEGHRCRFRLPSGRDLTETAGQGLDAAEATRRVLGRCVLGISRDDGQEVAVETLPDTVARAVSNAMAEADPQADVQLALACPDCGGTWQTEFDILAFFWDELQCWARNLLLDVHGLATAYGWTEPDVLALGPRRRRLYLEILGG